MARLTKKSPDLNELFRSDYTKPELARKLGLIEDRAGGLASAVCDYCCRFPYICRNQQELENVCQECPVTRLVNLIG